MQYFRNTSRRMTDCPNPRDAGMIPLCRNDDGCRANDMRERQSGCGCMQNTRNAENDRAGGCCEAGLQNAESVRLERAGRCTCADNTRSERTGQCGCANNTRSERSCMNTRADRPNGCGCVDDHMLRCDDTPTAEVYGCTGLAMAFVPEQEFCDINEAEEALCRGSLFQKLDMPFYGQRRRNCK